MLTAGSRFSRLAEPVAVPLGQIGKRGFTTLIAGGFVDAFGPTLNVITVDGQFQMDQERAALLRIGLSPYSQTCDILGYVTVGDTWAPKEDLMPYLPVTLFRTCPTLLIPSAVLPSEVTHTLCTRFLSGFGKSPDALAKLLLTPEYIHAELTAFLDAWDGAIQFQNGTGAGVSRSMMPTDEFLGVLIRLCLSCDLSFLH
jgi:hypothetical protein